MSIEWVLLGFVLGYAVGHFHRAILQRLLKSRHKKELEKFWESRDYDYRSKYPKMMANSLLGKRHNHHFATQRDGSLACSCGESIAIGETKVYENDSDGYYHAADSAQRK